MQTDTDIPEAIKRAPAFLVRTHFFAGGLVNQYKVWFQGGMEIPLQEIAIELSKIMAGHPAINIEGDRHPF